MKKSTYKNSSITVLGLGYVGLPLALEFAKKRKVIGFDIDKDRVKKLNQGFDSNSEIPHKKIKNSKNIIFTNEIDNIKKSKIHIVTIPTPVDHKNNPDLSLLKYCCEMIGSVIKKNDLIIFESTVYPGVTEEVCAPIIEKKSGLVFNNDFFCGYSPERINPGDNQHNISNIQKVTSGSTPESANIVDSLYKEIVKVGTHPAPTIKIAEAAKVIENIQRDLNIALMNELSMIFGKMDIDTKSVIDAAASKWNFMPFKPGLVGGHCIGVDPYYLTYKSLKLNHRPKMILAGRQINESMSSYIAFQLKDLMIKKKLNFKNSKILIMGFAFKENISDIRNTKIFDLLREIKKFNNNIDVFDPLVSKDDVKKIYKINLINELTKGKYEAIIIAVAHDEFKKLSINQIRAFGKKRHIIYDLKHLLNFGEANLRL